MAARRCCCAAGDCLVHEEYFTNRAETTDLGEDWIEVVGDWEIEQLYPGYPLSSYLTVAQSGAVLLCAKQTPAIAQVLRSGVNLPSGSAMPRLILDAQYSVGSGLGPYYAIEFQNTITRFLYIDGASVDELYVSDAGLATGGTGFWGVGGFITLEDGAGIRALSGGLDADCITCPPSASGWGCGTGAGDRYAGFGSGSSTKPRFEYINLQDHYQHNAICLRCDCLCEDSCVPRTLNALYILDSATGCECPSSFEVEIEYDPCIAFPTRKCGWRYEGTPITICSQWSVPVLFREGNSVGDWRLTDAGSVSHTPSDVWPAVGSTCSPFSLEFYITFTTDDPASCAYHVYITEV